MNQEREGREAEGQTRAEAASRPQKGGEAETTRFGMEEGDNTDVPATGWSTREEDGAAGSS